MARDLPAAPAPSKPAPSIDPKPTSTTPSASVHTARSYDPPNRQGGTPQGVSHLPGSLGRMMQAASGRPKVYGNNANHPGHTTAAFLKQKVGTAQDGYGALKQPVQPTQSFGALKQPADNPPNSPVAAISPDYNLNIIKQQQRDPQPNADDAAMSKAWKP